MSSIVGWDSPVPNSDDSNKNELTGKIIEVRGRFFQVEFDKSIVAGMLFKAEIDGEFHYFNTTRQSVNYNDKTIIKCTEAGLASNTFSRRDGFDFNTLIGTVVTEVTDEEEIDKVIALSCLC